MKCFESTCNSICILKVFVFEIILFRIDLFKSQNYFKMHKNPSVFFGIFDLRFPTCRSKRIFHFKKS